MNEPTHAEIKELWELVGFEFEYAWSDYQPYKDPSGVIQHHGTPIDLNNLFKWAVPKVYDMEIRKLNRFDGECQTAYSVRVRLARKCWMMEVRDKELKWAMFWAYYKVLTV